MDVEQGLNKLFTRYVDAFTQYNMEAALSCYHLPCTLHTPDKIAYLNNEETFKQEFTDIFTVLQHANISKIVADKSSYQYCQKNSVDVCVNWLFYDDNNQIFTDFSAFFHIVKDEEQAENCWRIVSVVSHEIENAVELAQTFNIA